MNEQPHLFRRHFYQKQHGIIVIHIDKDANNILQAIKYKLKLVCFEC